MLGNIIKYNDAIFEGNIKGFDDKIYTFTYLEFKDFNDIKQDALVEFDYDFRNGKDLPYAKSIKLAKINKE